MGREGRIEETEAAAEDSEMSVCVKRGAGKSYSEKGSLFLLEVVGVPLPF